MFFVDFLQTFEFSSPVASPTVTSSGSVTEKMSDKHQIIRLYEEGERGSLCPIFIDQMMHWLDYCHSQGTHRPFSPITYVYIYVFLFSENYFIIYQLEVLADFLYLFCLCVFPFFVHQCKMLIESANDCESLLKRQNLKLESNEIVSVDSMREERKIYFYMFYQF